MRSFRSQTGQTATEYVVLFSVVALLLLMVLDAYIYPALVQGQAGFNKNLEREVNKGYSGSGGSGKR